MPIDSLRRCKVLAFLAALAVHIFAETFVQFKDTTSTTSALRGQVQSKATEATDSETFPKSPMPMAKVTGTDAEVDPSNPSNTDTKPLSYYAGMLTNPPSEEDSEKDMITPTLKFIGYGAVFGLLIWLCSSDWTLKVLLESFNAIVTIYSQTGLQAFMSSWVYMNSQWQKTNLQKK